MVMVVVVSDVVLHLRVAFVPAITRHGSPSELQRQQREQSNDKPTMHASQSSSRWVWGDRVVLTSGAMSQHASEEGRALAINLGAIDLSTVLAGQPSSLGINARVAERSEATRKNPALQLRDRLTLQLRP